MSGLSLALSVDPRPDLFHTLVAHGRRLAGATVPDWWFDLLAADATCIDTAERAPATRWGRAVAAFAEVADRDVLFDDGLRRLGDLAHRPPWRNPGPRGIQFDDLELADVELEPLARQWDAMTGAAAAHFDHLWPAHRRAADAWVEAWESSGARLVDEVSDRVAAAFGIDWPSAPVPVDVTTYAHPVGAYTTNRPDRITVAAGHPLLRGSAALEVLVHEAVHTVDHLLVEAVAAAEAATGVIAPPTLWHSLVFIVVADCTAAVVPSHVAYAEQVGLFARHGWERAGETTAWCHEVIRRGHPLLGELAALLARLGTDTGQVPR